MKTVVIAGSGCNTIGWGPVETAIRNSFPNPSLAPNLKPTYIFSLLNVQLRYLKKMSEVPGTAEYYQDVANICNEKLELRRKIINNIAKEIEDAQKNATLRTVSNPEVDKLLLANENVWFTLNWDTLLDHKLNKPVAHLHGQINNPATLLLPTEIVTIDNWLFQNAYSLLMTTHSLFIEIMKVTQRIIIWGCSLDDYDAEIQTLAAEATRVGRLKEVILIDIKPEIKDKAEFLFKVPVQFINPT